VNTEKSLGTVLTEAKDEIKEFILTRFEILRSEVREKVETWKYSIPLLLLAGGLLLLGGMVVTFAFVALIRAWFLPSVYAWVWAGAVVAALYLIAGLAVGWFAYSELRSAGVAPKRTLEVLKQDQVWIETEARTI
jgi:uncharacterized membrane protein YqjE